MMNKTQQKFAQVSRNQNRTNHRLYALVVFIKHPLIVREFQTSNKKFLHIEHQLPAKIN